MNYYKEIKNKLIDNEIYSRSKDYSKESNRLLTYYEVGRLLSEAGKHYGEGIISTYSKRLTVDVGNGYSTTNLKRMRQFYYLIKKGVALPHQLTWSHIISILPIKEMEKLKYYISISIENNLSYRALRKRIKNKEYERLPYKKINNIENNSITDFIKDPIVIKSNSETISEKVLKRIILEDIESFMNELGNGYTFVGSEYGIKIGNNYNYIDILLFNVIFNCYVIIELKVTSLKKEHIGQIEIYMNYIDNNIRRVIHDKTIGIIICKKNNHFIMEYCSDDRIISREYKILP